MAGQNDWDALLCQPPPRAVPQGLRTLALRGRAAWLASLAALAVVCGLIVAALFPYDIHKDLRLDWFAVAGRGEVLSAAYAKRTIGDDIIARKRLVFEIRFWFDAIDGRRHEVSCLYFGALVPGATVEIEYLPSAPGVARLRDGFFVPGGLWEVAWSLAFAIPPLFGFWNFQRWQRRRLSLLVDGQVAQGRIVRTWRDDPHDTGRGWYAMTFIGPNGQLEVQTSVTGATFRRAEALAQAGDPVRLLYDPANPRQTLVFDLAD